MELTCETDFVAKNDDFIKLGKDLVALAYQESCQDVEAFLLMPYAGQTVAAALTACIATLGENMSVRRMAIYEAGAKGLIDLYSHGGGRIAVLVRLELGSPEATTKPQLQALVHDLALQIVAAKAQYISTDDVPAEVIVAEKAIYEAQAINEGRAANIVERMVEGRLRKYLEDVCLLKQVYIKDTSLTVEQLIANLAKECGTTISVAQFVRYEIGEGIEDSEE